ncbi:universal stress protein [Marivita geojedonensis]|uniref:Universal stress protein n=1 Tax=Marivita geojedonensis TaxID=1123756 RepID=A0A1X4NPG9_9RHOB|nr:universal stress protein [Marivita geojedonensis]OSQ52605.1 universal stress protein [Marivita geojedonensis]PRY80802.1 nucleotide-binding universal stress UspA family protein [Marivita geojedonensis]
MSFKTILAVVTDQSHLSDTISQGISMASALDAHMDVVCLGVDRTQTGYYYAGMNAAVLQETLHQARQDASELAAAAKKQMGQSDLRWGVTEAVCQLADIARFVASHARFADLAILPRPYGEDRGIELEPVVEGALFEGQSPVIVLPENGPELKLPQKVAIGWNESTEALRAVRSALPLLSQAQTAHIVVIDPPKHGPNRSDPGGQLSQYLARHGVKVEIDVLSKTMPRVSDVMRRHVTDISADLVVMGAYGHSRFREAILGGATRNMLENCEVPVFMAH